MDWPLRLAHGVAALAGLALLTGTPAARAADLYDDYRPHASYKDHWGDKDRYDGYERQAYRRHDGCTPREIIRERLVDQGWRDFHNADPRGAYVVVEARRPSGRAFHLRIDRCTGDIVLARPLEPRHRYWRSRWDERWEDRPEFHRRPLVSLSVRANRRFYDAF